MRGIQMLENKIHISLATVSCPVLPSLAPSKHISPASPKTCDRDRAPEPRHIAHSHHPSLLSSSLMLL